MGSHPRYLRRYFCHKMTHGENIKTLKDNNSHLKHEADRHDFGGLRSETLYARGKSQRKTEGFHSDNKPQGVNKGPKKQSPPQSKVGENRERVHHGTRGVRSSERKSKQGSCFNYDKKGHFARDCTEMKKD
ncbi:hypothetical protein Drorol1_Dr00011076 [Drosera rotundifolia]